MPVSRESSRSVHSFAGRCPFGHLVFRGPRLSTPACFRSISTVSLAMCGRLDAPANRLQRNNTHLFVVHRAVD